MDQDRQKRYGTKRQDAGSRSRWQLGAQTSSGARHTAGSDNPYLTRDTSSRTKERPRCIRNSEGAARRSRTSGDAKPQGSAVAGKASSVARSVGSAAKGIAAKVGSGLGGLSARFGTGRVVGVAAALVLALALGVGFLTRISVTVNDQAVTVASWSNAKKLIDKGYATPVPGNLLAVDGSVITEGGGDLAAVTINGEAATLASKLRRGDVVTIGDGADVTEEYTSTEEAIAHGSSGDEASFENYWNGSIHLLSDGQDGVRTIKTGTVSGKTAEEITTPPIDSGFHIYTANPGEDKVIALTFDDGPWPETTDAILDILEENGAKATFFTIGNQIAEHPDQVRRAHEMGCQVCTHTWDHAAGSGGGVNICYMSAEEQVSEITKGYQAITDVTGVEPAHIFRAPGGNFYGDAVTNLWSYVDAEIGWDVDTEDWSLPGSDYIAQMILSVKPGQVILMHDGGGDRTQTVEGLRQALPQLVEQGYSFVTIDELLAYGMPSGDAV